MVSRVVRRVTLVVLSVALVAALGWSARAGAADSRGVFFSQGQAVFNAQDKAKSQQEAIRDFLAQGVMQATGSFLNPSQMGTAYGRLQEKVLARPDRYVETYQVFSENQGGGLYRVTGQVTVSLDVLRKDLVESGLLAEQAPAAEPASQEASGDTTAANGNAEPAEEATAPADASSTEAAPAETASGGAEAGEGQRGIRLARQEILWAVTERWDQDWVLPRDLRDARSLFALSAAREIQDFDWDMRLPESAPLSMDETGNVSVSQAIAMAKSAGIPYVVVGTVMLHERQNEPTRLEATLRILDVAAGRSRGEIHKQRQIGEGTNQEGALELASLMVPKLDSILREAGALEGTPQSRSVAATEQSGGPWTLLIGFDHQIGAWGDIEHFLRERFKSLQVRSLEFTPGAAKVILDGVDGNGLRSLDGAMLPHGAKVQMKSYSAEQHVIEIALASSGNSQ